MSKVFLNTGCGRLRFAAMTVMCFHAAAACAQAPDYCVNVLQYGVFDRANKLDIQSKYDLVRSAMCQSSNRSSGAGGSLSYGLWQADASTHSAEVDNICTNSSIENTSSSNVREVVSRASSVIVGAWLECVRSNKGGVSHYFVTTDDPAQFSYRIDFTPTEIGGDAQTVTLSDLTIKNATCRSADEAKGRTITTGGWELACTRRPENTVMATLNTKDGFGMRGLRSINLPAYKADAPVKRWSTVYAASALPDHGFMKFDSASGLIVGVGRNPITGSENYALYHVDAPHSGRYLVTTEWAAGQDVPVSVFVNIPPGWVNCSAGLEPALTVNRTSTGGWDAAHVMSNVLGTIRLEQGVNTIVFTDYPC